MDRAPAPRPRGNGRTILWIVAGTVVLTAAGLFHVYSAQEGLALRRAIWVELVHSRRLDDERTDLRRQQVEMTAVPRATVKAQAMGLKPPRADQVIRADGAEEAVP